MSQVKFNSYKRQAYWLIKCCQKKKEITQRVDAITVAHSQSKENQTFLNEKLFTCLCWASPEPKTVAKELRERQESLSRNPYTGISVGGKETGLLRPELASTTLN